MTAVPFRALARVMFAVAVVLCGAAARADTVAEWSRIALSTVSELEADPARAARNLATVHIAMFEAMNFIEGGYAPRYLVKPQRPAGMSSEATAAAAAHRVLVELYPARADALDHSLERSFTALFGAPQRNSVVIGEKLADIVRAVRRRHEPLIGSAGPRGESVQDAVAWASTISRYLEDSPRRPIEHARLYAIAALAVDQAYAPDRRGSACISCSVSAAVDVIVRRASGPAAAPPPAQRRHGTEADASGVKLGTEALRQYPQAR